MAAYRRVDGFKWPGCWLPVHRDQLLVQLSVTSMGGLTFTFSLLYAGYQQAVIFIAAFATANRKLYKFYKSQAWWIIRIIVTAVGGGMNVCPGRYESSCRHWSVVTHWSVSLPLTITDQSCSSDVHRSPAGAHRARRATGISFHRTILSCTPSEGDRQLRCADREVVN